MALKFGTSGVRGLVGEMTDRECYLFTRAYCRYLRERGGWREEVVAVAGDLRPSTPRIINAVARACADSGFDTEILGHLPTPALAFHGLTRGSGSVMVTGSHIPADRNGIKFYLPHGEVLKADEQRISALYRELKDSGCARERFAGDGSFAPPPPSLRLDDRGSVARAFLARYRDFLPNAALRGLELVVYLHSSVGRDLLVDLLRALGATVHPVSWADRFVAVDTEAVEDPEQIAAWVRDYRADALVSTDGDADRPLVADETGRLVHGDLLGILVAAALDADSVSCPVSCNTALERSGRFADVRRTRIGSPYVIAAMQKASAAGWQRVVGFEANGGFLTNSRFPGAAADLTPLPTRDAFLPIVTVLRRVVAEGRPLSAITAELPARYTVSGRLKGFPSDRGKQLVEEAREDPQGFVQKYLAEDFGKLVNRDFTDGARFSFADGRILHLRPSGNAPEFRCYTEADSREAAQAANDRALAIIDQRRRD